MKKDKINVAGYGLHYHANNQLVPNASDRVLLQCIVDIVRNQLKKSLDDQSIVGPISYLSRVSGLDAYRTIPGCLKRLEALGLIKKHKNAITLNCDEYVTLIRDYESQDIAGKQFYAKDFAQRGTCILADRQIEIVQGCRSELLGISGSSIALNEKNCKVADILPTDSEKPARLQIFDDDEEKTCNIADISTTAGEKPATMQVFEQQNPENLQPYIYATLQKNLQAMAKNLQGCRFYMGFDQFCELFDPATLKGDTYEFLKSAFFTGEVPSTMKIDLEKTCNLAGLICATLQVFCEKYVQPCSTVINIYNNKKNKGSEAPLIKGENKEESSEKGYEDFGKVEIIDFGEPSQEDVDLSQQMLKRADRTLRNRNPYRNKPFIKFERVRDIVNCLDDVVKSPVDFFLHHFCWGIYDLYCDNYYPSERIDEEGELIEEPQDLNWKEALSAPLPQDEIYSLAKNIYEDMVGAVEQGRYFYNGNREIRFSFDSFEDFNPFQIFQWKPSTMKNKSIPALVVAWDKFYDIEAPDVFTPTKGDRRIKNAQNKKFVQFVMEADEKNLTPLEAAIKSFFQTFVIFAEEWIVNEFTDSDRIPLECGCLPDHILRPWCYKYPGIGYNEFTQVISPQYKPCDGVYKRSTIFSAESVVEWNERNGYHDTIAHQAIQD